MREDDVAQMIREYGSGLPRFQRRARRLHVKRWLVYAAAASVAALAVILSTPRAQANGYQQMVDALKDVHTMESQSYKRGMDGKYTLFMRQWLNGSKLAAEALPKHLLIAVTPKDHLITYTDLHVTTWQPKDSSWDSLFQGKKSALDWVMASNNFGVVGAKQTITRRDSPPMNGRPVYILELVKRDEELGSTFETLWVDSKTNLPIRCSVTMTDPKRGPDVSYTDYQFDVAVPDAVFEPQYTPVVNVVDREAVRVKQWLAAPAARGPKSTLLDAQVAGDGSLYLLFVGNYAPAEVRGEHREKYVEAAAYRPGGVRWDGPKVNERLDKLGKPVWGVVFVPATILSAPPNRFRIAMRPVANENGWRWDAIETKSGPEEVADVVAKTCVTWPDYAFDLVLADYFRQVDSFRATARAKALEAAGDVDDALAVYRAGYEAKMRIFPATGYRMLIPAEAMLRQAGRYTEADKLKAQIEADRRQDPSLPTPVPKP